MAQAREIKNRINSIGSTAKITSALQMISAFKMQKAQLRATQTSFYAAGLYELVNKLGSIKDYKSPFLREVSQANNIAVIIIGTSRGFVGSMISNLTRAAINLKNELATKYPLAQLHAISVHKTGLKVSQAAGIQNDVHFAEYKDKPTTTDFTALFQYIIDGFVSQKFDLVYVVYAEFISTAVQKPIAKKVLPLSIEDLTNDETESKNDTEKHPETGYFIYEPSQEGILERLLPQYFETQLYTAVLNSIAAEHSARMIAMKNATDNAKEVRKQLNMEYNRQRQAGITQQIIEVINGAN